MGNKLKDLSADRDEKADTINENSSNSDADIFKDNTFDNDDDFFSTLELDGNPMMSNDVSNQFKNLSNDSSNQSETAANAHLFAGEMKLERPSIRCNSTSSKFGMVCDTKDSLTLSQNATSDIICSIHPFLPHCTSEYSEGQCTEEIKVPAAQKRSVSN